jgi:hypothetical protein
MVSVVVAVADTELRKVVVAFARAGGHDPDVSTRKISDQLEHSKISMTQDRYLGRQLTDRQTAELLEGPFGASGSQSVPGSRSEITSRPVTSGCGGPPGDRTLNPRIKSSEFTQAEQDYLGMFGLCWTADTHARLGCAALCWTTVGHGKDQPTQR